MAEFSILNKEHQAQLTRAFDEFNTTVERQILIAVIRDTLRRFEENDYPRLLSQMTTWAQPTSKHEETSKSDISDAGEKLSSPVNVELQIEYVSSRELKISFDKAWLADEKDVVRYLESMRESLLKEIKKGKRIQI